VSMTALHQWFLKLCASFAEEMSYESPSRYFTIEMWLYRRIPIGWIRQFVFVICRIITIVVVSTVVILGSLFDMLLSMFETLQTVMCMVWDIISDRELYQSFVQRFHEVGDNTWLKGRL